MRHRRFRRRRAMEQVVTAKVKTKDDENIKHKRIHNLRSLLEKNEIFGRAIMAVFMAIVTVIVGVYGVRIADKQADIAMLQAEIMEQQNRIEEQLNIPVFTIEQIDKNNKFRVSLVSGKAFRVYVTCFSIVKLSAPWSRPVIKMGDSNYSSEAFSFITNSYDFSFKIFEKDFELEYLSKWKTEFPEENLPRFNTSYLVNVISEDYYKQIRKHIFEFGNSDFSVQSNKMLFIHNPNPGAIDIQGDGWWSPWFGPDEASIYDDNQWQKESLYMNMSPWVIDADEYWQGEKDRELEKHFNALRAIINKQRN